MLTEDYKRKALKKIEGMSNEELKKLLKSIGSKPKKDEWITRATHVLHEIEFNGPWSSYADPDIPNVTWDEGTCPYCGTTDKHKDNCELHKLLEEAKDIK